jgi:hypothetical protein
MWSRTGVLPGVLRSALMDRIGRLVASERYASTRIENGVLSVVPKCHYADTSVGRSEGSVAASESVATDVVSENLELVDLMKSSLPYFCTCGFRSI